METDSFPRKSNKLLFKQIKTDKYSGLVETAEFYSEAVLA
jgi:hypothetical protein